MKAVVWMHRDLRLADHPALDAALTARRQEEVSAVEVVYSWSEAVYGDWMPGRAQQWWIHEHLLNVSERLAQQGVRVVATREAPSAFLVEADDIHSVHFNDPLLPAAREEARCLRREADRLDIPISEYSGDLLHDPSHIRTQQGDPYKVYTPFSRRFREQVPHAQCEPLAVDWSEMEARGQETHEAVSAETARDLASEAQAGIEALGLHPGHDWVTSLEAAWEVGEAAAHARLASFVEGPVMDYAEARNRPDADGTSRLSPYLAIGVLSPRQVYTAVVRARGDAQSNSDADGLDTFLREIIWREFGYHLLRHFPHTPSEPLRPEWSRFPWRDDEAARARWQQGMTGFPIVDAGMRQLWKTGWMHNRVRMIVASFLTKDLMIRWQDGAAWFWDTLIDADLASNTMGWQWAAGSGADAQPYFRIFNPESQLKKHDPDGSYVRAWIPELSSLTYPDPMVDHAAARNRALTAYESYRKTSKK